MAFELAFVDSIGDTYTAITDSFTRSVTDGLGSTTTGQPYTLQGTAANFDVGGATATVAPTTLATDYAGTFTTGGVDNDMQKSFSINALPASGTLSVGVVVRQVDSSNRYWAEAQIPSTGIVTLRIRKRTTAGGLATITSAASITVAAATQYTIRARIVDGQIQVKLWLASGAQPSWGCTAFDADLTTGTDAGLFVRDDTASATHVVTIDNLSATAPTQTRLDLNDGTIWRALGDQTSFDAPELRRSITSSMTRPGELVNAATYANRVCTMAWDVTALAPDAAAAQIQLLSRELDRAGNFLRYKPDTSQPVWFRTFRSDYTSVIWDGVLKRLTVRVLADPFAYGRREVLAPVTVNNDPAAGSNGMFFDVTAVKGDVETPLSMMFPTSVLSGGANPDTNRFTSHIATRRRGDPTQLAWIFQCESGTGGPDTTNNANASHSNGNAARVSFATVATLATRTSLVFPSPLSLANDELRGTYRAYLRCKKSAAGSGPMTVQLKWGSQDAGQLFTNTEVTVGLDAGPSAPTYRWVDLGTVTIPPLAPAEDFGGRAIQPEGIFIGVGAARASGTGSLDLDVVMLIPADDQTLLVKWPGVGNATTVDVMLDPTGRVGSANLPALTVYGRVAGGLTRALMPARPVGGAIDVSPGPQGNRVWFVKDVGSDNPANDVGDDKATTTTITPMYHPRYVQHMRPAST